MLVQGRRLGDSRSYDVLDVVLVVGFHLLLAAFVVLLFFSSCRPSTAAASSAPIAIIIIIIDSYYYYYSGVSPAARPSPSRWPPGVNAVKVSQISGKHIGQTRPILTSPVRCARAGVNAVKFSQSSGQGSSQIGLE